jgi:hypothetical protein
MVSLQLIMDCLELFLAYILVTAPQILYAALQPSKRRRNKWRLQIYSLEQYAPDDLALGQGIFRGRVIRAAKYT